MDELIYVFIGFALAVLTPYVRKLLEYAYAMAASKVRQMNEVKRRRSQMEDSANEAAELALKSWKWAEFECEVKRKEYVEAYGGQYLTINEKIECWEAVVIKCNEAASLLEQNNETKRAGIFRNNASIASRNVIELENHPERRTTRIVVGIDEAKRREYDAKRAKNSNDNLIKFW